MEEEGIDRKKEANGEGEGGCMLSTSTTTIRLPANGRKKEKELYRQREGGKKGGKEGCG